MESTITKVSGRYTAKSPISHGSDEDFGMEQRLRTLQMTVEEDGERFQEEIPVISGNSLRGRMRDLLAEDLLARLDLEVHDTLLYSLYSGGNLQRGAGGRKIKRSRINEVRDKVPMLSLLGTALGTQMIEGKLNVDMLIPVASETEDYTGAKSDTSVFSYVDDVFYTRKDDIEGQTDSGGSGSADQAQQMKFNIQVFTPGTEFVHDLVLRSTSKIEASCLAHAINLFSQNPRLGGMEARGHGRVEFEYDDQLPPPDVYTEYVDSNKQEIREFLEKVDRDLED